VLLGHRRENNLNPACEDFIRWESMGYNVDQFHVCRIQVSTRGGQSRRDCVEEALLESDFRGR
jgi:hypothetical protein